MYTRDLMHFDHFAIRLLDRKNNKLELVISVGLPPEAQDVSAGVSENESPPADKLR